MGDELNLHEFELEGGKTVKLRTMQIRDWDQAAKCASRDSSGDQFVFGIRLQQELMKILLVEVDGKSLTMMQKESLDSLFTVNEYLALQDEVQALMGKTKVLRRALAKSSGVK